MDGPQACSRWARQHQPQLRHFKKPLVGPLPSPSSHSGRSEAPENSETSPREKGNLGLPVLLTDGSTHLEQILGSDRAALSQRTVICGVKSGARRPEDAQDASVRGGRRRRRGGQRSLVQMNCSAQHGGVACYSAELRLCSAVLQHLEFEVRGRRGVYSHVPFFSGQMVRRETRMCGWVGASPEIKFKKRAPTFSHNPLCVGMWKVRCMWNIQEVVIWFEYKVIVMLFVLSDVFVALGKNVFPKLFAYCFYLNL